MLIESNKLRSFLHTKIFNYSIDKYPFKEILENLFGTELSNLHKTLGNFKKFEVKNNISTDQSTLAHKVFYSNFSRTIEPLYKKFIKEVIIPILHPHKFYYQQIPTFRVGLPENTFVGEFHKDSFYNHQNYEINFNLGLANYVGDAALKTQLKPGSDKYIILECPYGSIFSFDHIDCIHGAEPNPLGKTMVSFDFRLALQDLYYSSDNRSINQGKGFNRGEYFSKELAHKL